MNVFGLPLSRNYKLSNSPKKLTAHQVWLFGVASLLLALDFTCEKKSGKTFAKDNSPGLLYTFTHKKVSNKQGECVAEKEKSGLFVWVKCLGPMHASLFYNIYDKNVTISGKRGVRECVAGKKSLGFMSGRYAHNFVVMTF